MMKLGKVIPYLKKIEKFNKSVRMSDVFVKFLDIL